MWCASWPQGLDSSRGDSCAAMFVGSLRRSTRKVEDFVDWRLHEEVSFCSSRKFLPFGGEALS
jgi:hypothetical protein